MRKNLHYKVLASVLAIAGLYFYNAPAAWADIVKVHDNPEIWVGNGTITNNNNQQIQTDAEVYGGHDGYNSNANNNNITITGDNNSFYSIAGGYTSSGTATNNTVTISGDVTLSNTSYNSCIAGGIGFSNSKVTNNQVTIQSGTVTGNIYGGYISSHSTDHSEISGNNITIINIEDKNIDISGADLYGGYAAGNNIEIRNNTLTLDGWSGSVKSVQNFSDINFENIKWSNGGTVLNITNNDKANALANTNINLNNLNFAGGTELNEGESMTFVNGTDLGIDENKVNVTDEFTAGVAVIGTGEVAYKIHFDKS